MAASLSSLEVIKVDKRRVRRQPPAPFITSTLQQESSRKLRLGADQTMRAAQVMVYIVDVVVVVVVVVVGGRGAFFRLVCRLSSVLELTLVNRLLAAIFSQLWSSTCTSCYSICIPV